MAWPGPAARDLVVLGKIDLHTREASDLHRGERYLAHQRRERALVIGVAAPLGRRHHLFERVVNFRGGQRRKTRHADELTEGATDVDLLADLLDSTGVIHDHLDLLISARLGLDRHGHGVGSIDNTFDHPWVKEHVAVEQHHVAIEKVLARGEQRLGRVGLEEMMVHHLVEAQVGVLGAGVGHDLLAAIAEHQAHLTDAAGAQGRHLMIKDGPLPHLEQALGAVLSEGEEAAGDSGNKNDTNHNARFPQIAGLRLK
jgi:hypothetical protein